jgi:enterochelin esterase-like enzyme
VVHLLLLLSLNTVTIHYKSATAHKVEVAGDITDWDHPKPLQKTDDDWSIKFKVPADARFEYKLIVDGNWILDPSDPLKIDNTLGGENSVYQGPGYHFHPDDAPPKHPMQRSTFKVKDRDIIVFSPANPVGKPLLVYGDGPNYETYGHIQNVVENLVEAGKIRPVVIVLVPPVDRMKDYGTDWRAYGDYLLNSVLPDVRRRTGASKKASDLFLGGSSLGGVISLRLAEAYPDKVAGGVHSQSGAFQWSPLKLHYSDLIELKGLRRLAPTTRLWIDWGRFEDDLTPANETAAKNLRTLKRPFGHMITDEGHNWTAWRNRMVGGLRYLLGTPR